MSRTTPAKWITKPGVAVLVPAFVLTAALMVIGLVNRSLGEIVDLLPFLLAYLFVPGLVGVMAAVVTRRFARWQQWLTATGTVLLAMFAGGWWISPFYPLEPHRSFGAGMVVVIYVGPVYLVVTAVVAVVMAVITRVRARRVRKTQLSR